MALSKPMQFHARRRVIRSVAPAAKVFACPTATAWISYSHSASGGGRVQTGTGERPVHRRACRVSLYKIFIAPVRRTPPPQYRRELPQKGLLYSSDEKHLSSQRKSLQRYPHRPLAHQQRHVPLLLRRRQPSRHQCLGSVCRRQRTLYAPQRYADRGVRGFGVPGGEEGGQQYMHAVERHGRRGRRRRRQPGHGRSGISSLGIHGEEG